MKHVKTGVNGPFPTIKAGKIVSLIKMWPIQTVFTGLNGPFQNDHLRISNLPEIGNGPFRVQAGFHQSE